MPIDNPWCGLDKATFAAGVQRSAGRLGRRFSGQLARRSGGALPDFPAAEDEGRRTGDGCSAAHFSQVRSRPPPLRGLGCLPTPEIHVPDFSPAPTADAGSMPVDAAAAIQAMAAGWMADGQLEPKTPCAQWAADAALSDAYAVGHNGLILHRSGGAWKQETAQVAESRSPRTSMVWRPPGCRVCGRRCGRDPATRRRHLDARRPGACHHGGAFGVTVRPAVK